MEPQTAWIGVIMTQSSDRGERTQKQAEERTLRFPHSQPRHFTLLSISSRMLTREQTLIIRFDDADPAGVIFYPRALALAHAAVEDLIRHSPLGWEAWFASRSHAAPLRHAEADFFRPMRPGETFNTVAAVEKIGATSVTFLVEFNDGQGHTAARVRTVHVLIDKTNGRTLPLTKEIRAAFSTPA